MPFFFVAGHHRLTENTAFLEGFSLEKLTAGTRTSSLLKRKNHLPGRITKKTFLIYDNVGAKSALEGYKMLLVSK